MAKRHRVKEHTREGRRVRTYMRGSGTRVKPITGMPRSSEESQLLRQFKPQLLRYEEINNALSILDRHELFVGEKELRRLEENFMDMKVDIISDMSTAGLTPEAFERLFRYKLDADFHNEMWELWSDVEHDRFD